MPSTLHDAIYRAICREQTVLAAKATRGHGEVFPCAEMTVKDGSAIFTHGGAEMWNCSAWYAAAHFDIQPV